MTFLYLEQAQRVAIIEEVKILLHASRDCLRNTGTNTLIIRYNTNDGYCGEAFGVMRTLKLLNYGYLGSSNLNAV